jgi:hypothetical protein
MKDTPLHLKKPAFEWGKSEKFHDGGAGEQEDYSDGEGMEGYNDKKPFQETFNRIHTRLLQL